MEIEAKFSIPNLEIFHRLQTLDTLAGFGLSAPQVKQVHDVYLDTEDRRILASGYACRRRERGQEVEITLKGLGLAEEGVHRREEWEVALPAGSIPLPAEWPASSVRDRVLEWVGDASLMSLFELHQTRHVRAVGQGERVVGELSLDQVRVVVAGGEVEQIYDELEVELAAGGREEDLAAMASSLREDWGLSPEPRSKFERGLLLMGESLPSADGRSTGKVLTPEERAVFKHVAVRDDLYGRRARALLAMDEGATQKEAGERVGRSDRTVRYWLAAFREKRLDIFPARILGGFVAESSASQAEQAIPVHQRWKSEHLSELGVLPLPETPGLEVEDSMSEAARKILYFHFVQMLHHEPDTRLGEDIEALHDMRVATRRMRAALRVFGDYLDKKDMKPLRKGLRRTGRALGTVRDLDVFWKKTERYLDGLPPEQRGGLDLLRAAWEEEREAARDRMLAYLDSRRYRRFKERLSRFLETPGAGALPVILEDGEPVPHRLCHVAPVVIYRRLAAVWAYDEWVTGPDVPLERLHQLRIAAKGLRYAVEYFREILNPEAKQFIDGIKELQDHLGDLQDAVVASNLLRDFLTWGTWGVDWAKGEPMSRPAEPVVAPGVAAYLAARQLELQRLLDTFPQVWALINSSEFVRLVGDMLSS